MVQREETRAAEGPAFPSIQAKLASCSKVVGEAFFPIMLEALAEMLSVRWAFICALHPFDQSKAVTVANWDNGPANNFEYSLENSPCDDIVGQGACCFPSGLADRFPRDQLLKDLGAQSYAGTPLHSSLGQILGLLVVLDDKPIENPDAVSEIIEAFSGRAAAELERLTTSSLNERLGRIVENSVSEVYIFNAQNYKFDLVNLGARENLGYSLQELRQLTPWDIKPQYTKEEFIAFVAPLINGKAPSLFFETLHKRKNGTTYDVAVQLQYFHGIENLFYASITDISERKRSDEARAHLAAIVSSSNEAIISKDLGGTIKSWNQGAEKIYGYSADRMIGRSIRRLIPDDRLDEEDEVIARIKRAEQVGNYETVRIRRDGRRVDVAVTASPILDVAGRVIGASTIAHDITEQKAVQMRERILMGEVNHRAKNLLALVQVIARQTAANDASTFAKRFEERIFALASSHDVLVGSHWQAVPLDDLIRSQLGHFQVQSATRISLSGPELKITAAAAQAFGMALHELATNASKYGSLSNDDGAVEITWDVARSAAGEQRFSLTWAESGGPEVTRPTQRGFGSTVIDRILKAYVEGEVDLDWCPTGLVCRVSCLANKVLDSVLPQDEQPDDNAHAVIQETPRAQASHILIVEDDALIGMEIADILREAGYEILGPVTSAGAAIKLLKGGLCDAAVLDINLGGHTSEPVAAFLSETGIPFMSVSGRVAGDRPAAFSGSPHLAKPVQQERLIKEVGQLLREKVSLTS